MNLPSKLKSLGELPFPSASLGAAQAAPLPPPRPRVWDGCSTKLTVALADWFHPELAQIAEDVNEGELVGSLPIKGRMQHLCESSKPAPTVESARNGYVNLSSYIPVIYAYFDSSVTLASRANLASSISRVTLSTILAGRNC